VPIQNLHNGGEFRKYITVATNAKNNPSFKVSISGIFRPLVELEPSGSLRLSSAKEKDTGEIITIKTANKDLKILDVLFKENGKELDWKATVPIKFSVTLDTAKQKKDTVKVKKAPAKGKPDTAKAPGQTNELLIYKVRVSYVPSSKTDLYGEFVIKTNLKDKAELKVSGTLEAKKD
jgi:hypothetical protein